MRPKFKLHYLTYALPSLHPGGAESGGEGGFQYPVPVKQLPRSLRNATAVGVKRKSKFAPYEMADLTVGSWVKLGRRVGDGAKKVRARFIENMYQGGEEE